MTGADGWPEQRRGVVDESPGLYFVGLPFLDSFASMLMGGAGRDARRVAAHILSRAGDPAAGKPEPVTAPSPAGTAGGARVRA